MQRKCAAEFVRVNAAFEVLSDATKKNHYDAVLLRGSEAAAAAAQRAYTGKLTVHRGERENLFSL